MALLHPAFPLPAIVQPVFLGKRIALAAIGPAIPAIHLVQKRSVDVDLGFLALEYRTAFKCGLTARDFTRATAQADFHKTESDGVAHLELVLDDFLTVDERPVRTRQIGEQDVFAPDLQKRVNTGHARVVDPKIGRENSPQHYLLFYKLTGMGGLALWTQNIQTHRCSCGFFCFHLRIP